MKILAIGDIHGKTTWHELCEKYYDKVDKIIFLGDYVDTHFNIPVEEIGFNFKNIIEYAKSHDKVSLLKGNHDEAYIHGFGCSNMAYWYRKEYLSLYNSYDFKYCLIIDNYIFSHAGITNAWSKIFDGDIKEDTINNLSKYVLNQVGKKRGGCEIPGIVWCDLSELFEDPLNGYNQVIGHTPMKDRNMSFKHNNNTIYPIDYYNETEVGYILIEI